jgi:hypothetical protein
MSRGPLPRMRRHRDAKPAWFYPVIGSFLIVLSVGLLTGAVVYDRNRTVHLEDAQGDEGLGTDDVLATDGSTNTTEQVPTTTTLPPFDGWVNPASVGQPYGDTVEGLITFRGNPTRTYYGEGPVPQNPEVLWAFPKSGGLCSQSSGETWCGTGWTGQPSVWEQDGTTWVAFGAYDAAVHWLDGETGERLLDDFPVGDIIKGSVTIDPDGYPILYTGARDNYFRAIAMDRDQPTELWSLWSEAVAPTLWNDDWDGSALIIDDYLFEGGENSQFHIVKLNRGYDENGLVTMNPELVFNAPSWDDELLAALGDDEVSVENSVAISGNTVYFANSGGLIQGWDITTLKEGGTPERVFRFWAGEDVDASIVVDEEGYLYAGVEWEKSRPRGQEVGQVIKLDPSNPDDPLVWSNQDNEVIKSGFWVTPATYGTQVYVPHNRGRVLAIDRVSGEIVWEKQLSGPTWQSPVIVDDVLIQGDCSGTLRGYDVSDQSIDPPELWEVELSGCIESTPAVWRGQIYVGARGGQVYGIGDPAGSDSSPSSTTSSPSSTTSTTGPPNQ